MARNRCETGYCTFPSLDVTDVCSLARGKGALLKQTTADIDQTKPLLKRNGYFFLYPFLSSLLSDRLQSGHQSNTKAGVFQQQFSLFFLFFHFFLTAVFGLMDEFRLAVAVAKIGRCLSFTYWLVRRSLRALGMLLIPVAELA